MRDGRDGVGGLDASGGDGQQRVGVTAILAVWEGLGGRVGGGWGGVCEITPRGRRRMDEEAMDGVGCTRADFVLCLSGL